jgi:hypothetical protein
MLDGRRRAAVGALVGAALVPLVAACSSAHPGATAASPASGATAAPASGAPTTGRPSAGSAPLGLSASTAPLPVLAGTGTATPPPYHRSRDSAAVVDAKAQVGLVYDAWMSDLTGLLANLTQPWVNAISELATPAMTTVAQRSAGALQQAHDHTVGTLVDSRRVITVTGSKAALTDCLDELHWYVVENANGRPDPSVTRGYFVGTADFVLTQGQWRVSSWNSHPERCTP